jgi:hypothetical protein
MNEKLLKTLKRTEFDRPAIMQFKEDLMSSAANKANVKQLNMGH